jgi:hypothetical protein
MFSDKSGFKVQAPCYFECRFIGPNAPGTWPAFWVISAKNDINEYYEPNDELDIIEAYGGEGPGSPNSGPRYGIAAHAWAQTGAAVTIADNFYANYFPADMSAHGIPSTWYETPHTYGLYVGLDYTNYCDNIEVGRHETMPVSKEKPFYFMVNLATGGGWPVDLSRYNGIADMYVDYVRVYGGSGSGNVAVTGVTVSPTSASLAVNGTQQLMATVSPSNATNKTVTWTSSNNAVATVSSTGLVTGIAAGTATITVTTQDGALTATSAITVTSGGGTKLTGAVIGTPGAYCCDNTIAHAFDGNVNSFVDVYEPSGPTPWAGLDLGSTRQITSIRFYPRLNWASRMVGGIFQGSNTANFSSGVQNLYTVTSDPPLAWTQVPVSNTNSFRYVRFLAPNAILNLAEIEFFEVSPLGRSGSGNSTKSAYVQEEEQARKSSIYPNPSTGIINIEGQVSKLSIISLSGQELLTLESVSNQVDVSFLPKGIYIARVIDGKGRRKSVKFEIK